MKSIHSDLPGCGRRVRHPGNYMMGANIAGFVKVVNAMLDQGVV
jgi:glutamate dehydrogenase (NADP+)